MKKTFTLTHEKIKYPRLVERAKNEVRKYIKRERRKTLPEGVDYWDFDCRFGDAADKAKPIHLTEIDACINKVEQREQTSFYLEILAKEGVRRKKPDEQAGQPTPELPKLKTFGES